MVSIESNIARNVAISDIQTVEILHAIEPLISKYAEPC